MEKEKMIHSVITKVNWELVLLNMKQLNPGKQITKLQLVEELTEMLNNVITTDKRQFVTDVWAISYERDEDGEYILEVMFTPVIVWIDTLAKNNRRNKVNRLEQRLKLALEVEDYMAAAKIKKSLEKLVLKPKITLFKK